MIEAVTSDGEVDEHKVRRMVAFANRHAKDGVGFTTAYPTWKIAAQRQSAHKNIPPSTYVWIREDGSKHYRSEEFGTGGSKPSTIRSKGSRSGNSFPMRRPIATRHFVDGYRRLRKSVAFTCV